MDLTDDEIHEFIGIWEKEFGEKLPFEQAKREAAHLLELYSLLARPLPHERRLGRKPTGPCP